MTYGLSVENIQRLRKLAVEGGDISLKVKKMKAYPKDSKRLFFTSQKLWDDYLHENDLPQDHSKLICVLGQLVEIVIVDSNSDMLGKFNKVSQ